jgi:hypothetical protein
MLVETIGEVIFLSSIVNGLARGVSRLKAQNEWVPENFMPARRPYRSSLYGLKHQFENGTRYYLHEDEMAEAFRANGITVIGEKVYAKKRPA